MRFLTLKHAISVLAVTLIIATPGLAPAVDPDWKAVEHALGKSGQLQVGDVLRVGMPRTDLTVTVKGVPVRAPFALGSYAAFKQIGDQVMVMGDLVLLDQEVPAVMSGLFSGGLEVTAVHNHLNEISPHVMYMHYEGHGDAVQLAKALRQALSASSTFSRFRRRPARRNCPGPRAGCVVPRGTARIQLGNDTVPGFGRAYFDPRVSESQSHWVTVAPFEFVESQ